MKKLIGAFGALGVFLILFVHADALTPAAVNGCQYNATPPSLSDLQTIAFQCDSAGNLKSVATGASGGALMLDATGQSILTSVNGPIPTQLPSVSIGGVGIIPPTAGAGTSIAAVVSGSAEGSHVIKASAGALYGFSVTTGASAGVVQILNATSAPVDGAITPIKCYDVAANSTVSASWEPIPLWFSTGITIVFSTGTACFTKAASATAFISGDVM